MATYKFSNIESGGTSSLLIADTTANCVSNVEVDITTYDTCDMVYSSSVSYPSEGGLSVSLGINKNEGPARTSLVKLTYMTNSPSIFNPNGQEYVDLGLPSGKLWAKKNIGADSETDAGLYFQWGDTEGFTQEQVTGDCKSKEFSWNDYKYGTESNLTKYNATDGLTTLELSDDAAHIHMGGGWRMPTKAEFLELTANTTNSWDSARSGYTFTANGNTLFLPACGMVYDGSFYSVSRYGDYWSSSLNTDGSDRGWTFAFDNSGNGEGYGARYYGYPIRGVLNQ